MRRKESLLMFALVAGGFLGSIYHGLSGDYGFNLSWDMSQHPFILAALLAVLLASVAVLLCHRDRQ